MMLRNLLLLIVILFLGIHTANAQADVCKYWRAQVDTATEVDFEIDEATPQNILVGIDCLLKLEGQKEQGLFSGATNNNISQIFPSSSVEICALYYASHLFHQDWKHANAVSLVGRDGTLNSEKDVRQAFQSYRLWLKKLRKLGLKKAREIKLDPLADARIRWY